MCMVQLASLAGFATSPGEWGAADLGEEDIMGYVHFWRVAGYYLGIDERYFTSELVRLMIFGKVRRIAQ